MNGRDVNWEQDSWTVALGFTEGKLYLPSLIWTGETCGCCSPCLCNAFDRVSYGILIARVVRYRLGRQTIDSKLAWLSGSKGLSSVVEIPSSCWLLVPFLWYLCWGQCCSVALNSKFADSEQEGWWSKLRSASQNKVCWSEEPWHVGEMDWHEPHEVQQRSFHVEWYNPI